MIYLKVQKHLFLNATIETLGKPKITENTASN